MHFLDTFIFDAIKSMGDGFYFIMKSFTYIGRDQIYFAAIVILMWCVNYRIFSKFTLLVPFSGLIAETLKLAIHSPRPHRIGVETSLGMPSGHALSAVAFWGYLAYVLKKWYAWIISIVIIIGIGLSRVYRLSHYPSQVVVGFILGAALLAVFIFILKKSKLFLRLSIRTQSIILIALPMIFLGASVLSYFLYADGLGLENLSGVIQLTGLFAGFGIGLLLMRKQPDFSVKVIWWKQLIKIAVGALSFILFPLVTKYSCKLTDNIFIESIIEFVLNFAMALWFVYIAPRLFIRFKLFTFC